MDDIISKGYAEQVPTAELERSDRRLWYIPHHGIYHPHKEKIRVVFDCGASYQRTFLNAELLQGPDLTSSLFGVLTRFRKEPVVILADIESMFYQVKVLAKDVDLLRFVWWPNGDLTQDLAAPSCSNFALRECAEDNEGLFSLDVTEKLLHTFCVDDCLVSTVGEEEAAVLRRDLVSTKFPKVVLS